MKNEYQKINMPLELLKWMSSNIQYGYVTREKRIVLPNQKEYNKLWFQEYRLQSADSILKTRTATCWDQVELERDWFESHNYTFQTYFEMIALNQKNPYPTHTFLVFQDNFGKWNWFENADFSNRGIHSFDTLEECLKKQQEKYFETLKLYHIPPEDMKKFVLIEYQKPQFGMDVTTYLNFVFQENKK